MIVTGFVDLSRYDAARTRPASEYHERAGWLLEAPASCLLFSDEPVSHGFFARRLPAEFEPVDQARAARALASGRQQIPWNPQKDTAAYLCLMRHKIEWMHRATTLYGARCYWWLDYGYRNLPGDRAERLLERLPPPGQIRIAELSYVPRAVRARREDFYRQHWWPLAGGVIAARAPEVAWLRDRIAEEWQWALDNEFAVTDEMMLGFIRFQHPERFDVYYADHPTLVTNYHAAHASHDLIRLMAYRAHEDGDDEASHARIKAILDAEHLAHHVER